MYHGQTTRLRSTHFFLGFVGPFGWSRARTSPTYSRQTSATTTCHGDDIVFLTLGAREMYNGVTTLSFRLSTAESPILSHHGSSIRQIYWLRRSSWWRSGIKVLLLRGLSRCFATVNAHNDIRSNRHEGPTKGRLFFRKTILFAVERISKSKSATLVPSTLVQLLVPCSCLFCNDKHRNQHKLIRNLFTTQQVEVGLGVERYDVLVVKFGEKNGYTDRPKILVA